MRLVWCWILLLILLAAAAAVPPVNRTQEARVLETAREMIGRPVGDWLIPKLNGHVRLRKPPLAYWASAGSMRVLGETEFAGRLPTVVMSWLAIGATFAIARRWFDREVAVYAAATLAGSWLAFKHGMLAETDAWAAAGMTLGVYAIVRAAEAGRARGTVWLHAVAVCLSVIILAKGPPATYLLLFWIGYCALLRDWSTLRQFVTRGAIVTLIVLSVPWFAYVFTHSTAEGQLGKDLANSADGGDHAGPPWTYIPMLIKATVPWTGVWVTALVMAAMVLRDRLAQQRAARIESPHATAQAVNPNGEAEPFPPQHSHPLEADSTCASDPRLAPWREDTTTRSSESNALLYLALWGAVILLPLCVWGNKQFHYLLPVMPPTFILVGWALAASVRREARGTATLVVASITGILLSLAPLAMIAAIGHFGTRPRALDWALLAALMVAETAVARTYRQPDRAVTLRAFLVQALLIMVAIHVWLPKTMGGRSRLASLELLARYPDARFVFRTTELPVMSWSMRRSVPTLDDAGLIALATDPHVVVLDQQQDNEKPPTPPTGYVEREAIKQGDNTLHVFVPSITP